MFLVVNKVAAMQKKKEEEKTKSQIANAQLVAIYNLGSPERGGA